jgi:hypothetical protein
MKKLLITLFFLFTSTALGLYYRPSFTLIGQLDWWNVLTKGYFVGAFSGFFSQSYLDESFWYVMRYSVSGLLIGIILSFMFTGKSKNTSKKKAK